MIADQTVAIEDMRRRLEVLQASLDDGRPATAQDSQWRQAIEQRISMLERGGVSAVYPGAALDGEAPAGEPVGVVPLPPGGIVDGEPAQAPAAVPPRAGEGSGQGRSALLTDLAREEAALEGARVDGDYRTAIRMIRDGQCTEAVPRLRGFVRKNIKSPFADNAQYWIGRCFHADGDHNRAIMELYDVLLKFPKSERVPGALLVLADAFADSGDDIDARLTLKKLLSDHPQAEEVEAAKQRLQALGE